MSRWSVSHPLGKDIEPRSLEAESREIWIFNQATGTPKCIAGRDWGQNYSSCYNLEGKYYIFYHLLLSFFF